MCGILLTIGDGVSGSDLTGSVADLNSAFSKGIQYAGYIVIALAVVKLIMAMSDQSPQSKSQASMMFGGGIIMVSFSAVLSSLAISSDTGNEQMVKNALGIIGKGLSYVGIILVVFAVFRLILAMMNTNAEEKASGSTMLATGIACMSGSTITDAIGYAMTHYLTYDHLGGLLVSYVALSVIGRTATYIGAGLLIFGVYHFFIGMREEDSAGKAQAGMEIGVAIALMSAVAIISAVTGVSWKAINSLY